jgi:flavin reductase
MSRFTTGVAVVTYATDTGPRGAAMNPLAWVECEPWRCYDGGDHTLVPGRVTDLGHRDGDALTYAWSRFGRISQGVGGIEYLF